MRFFRFFRNVLFVVLSTSVAGIASAGTPNLFDQRYSSRPLALQRKPPLVRLDPIVVPTPGSPALVSWGEDLEVTVLLPPGVGAGGPADWQVWLTTRIQGPDDRALGQPVDLRFGLLVSAVTAVAAVGQGPAPDAAVLRARVPAEPPRETYHLQVTGPGGLLGRRVHAVRVLGAAGREPFRFAVIGDHQLRDPSTRFGDGDLNNGSYPRRGRTGAESMLSQQVIELSFIDPDFVLYLGDLVYGTDYRSEYPATVERYWSRPLASYMVPGNHDGMALYELALKQGWWTEALKSVRCARHVLEGEVTAVGVFSLLACLYGDLKKILFSDLSQDGLDYWRRYLGPGDFSFDKGDYHFAGVNSYSGTPQRRHGFVLALDFLGVDLGVATVDNYGGWLTPAQLAWLERDLAAASAAGKKVVLFLHHDPRGNQGVRWGRRYHANLPFPTEPLGLRMFQEWNYEGNPDWDSDPGDGRAGETQTGNSAVSLLRLIAGHVDYVFTGHIHDDQDETVEAGQPITAGSGIRASRRVRFTRMATASATPLDDKGYWGFRRVTAGDGGLDPISYRPDWGWASLPSGNLWLVGEGVPAGDLVPGAPDDLLYSIHNGLPETIEGLLRAYLDSAPEGYRFSADGPGSRVRLVDVGRGLAGRNIYYLRVRAPGVEAGVVPPPKGEEPVTRIRARRATGNQVPVAAFERSIEQPAPGQPGQFDASPTRDPEGGPIAVYIWEFGDGASARGSKVAHVFERAGTYNVTLTAIDDCGAWARYGEGVVVSLPPSCAFSGTACAATSAGLVLFGMIAVGWWVFRRRLRSR